MAMPRRWIVLFAMAVLLAAAAAPPPAAAQEPTFPSCGDLELVFRNPDLVPDAQGFVHASGQFFIQFQAVGEQADRIETFSFSFGPDTVEYDEAACDRPVWFTGTYVLNYRADRDPSDGFFIPIKTDLVPDGTYAAAVHAYDAQDNELARFWARAIVDNCDGGEGSRCVDDAEQQKGHDIIGPWPVVLPGDGAAMEQRALSIEFGEPVQEVRVTLNGEDISDQLTEWEGRTWDADNVPDYGPAGLGQAVSPPCTQPFHTCIHYGPAFEWNGRPLADDDVVRVEAVDAAGNRMVKDLHIGSGIGGGAITSQAPNLQITVDEDRKLATAGQTVLFRFDMQNSGAGTAHPFGQAQAPEGWAAEFIPQHTPVGAGERVTQELSLRVPADAEPMTYDVNATFTWSASGREQQRSYALEVAIGGVTTLAPMNGTAGPASDGEDTPVPATLVPLAVGVVALALRRRQD